MTCDKKLEKARMQLLWQQPFFAVMLLNLKLVETTDNPQVSTMATDGKSLFYHPSFIEQLSLQQLIFILAHEVMHVALEHHLRCRGRDMKLWNMATDYAINLQLVEACIGEKPEGMLLDYEFSNMSAEEIYPLLIIEPAAQQQTQDNAISSPQSGQDSDPGGCGAVLDACKNANVSELSQMKRDIQTSIRQAISIAAGKAGGRENLPSGIRNIMDNSTKPIIDWRQTLRDYIDDSTRQDYSWSSPNRRMLSLDIIVPGLVSDGLNQLVVAIDTSASIDQKLLQLFATEIQAAFDEGIADELVVIYADQRVRKTETFTKGDKLILEAVGKGGTSFIDTFLWINKHASNASVIVYFTDLQTTEFGHEPMAPVIWAAYGKQKTYEVLAKRVPFGRPIHIPSY
ncbi:DUF2201 family putative metallopeptidase [Bartonella choladocola]|uniref:Metal-dependent peptidase n=1 Tax=Bartonella choladocola TaxID=2750995 RepID=A0A1U9MJ62_9HYPH|nr:VWA-like domain-containing protein [Bartonella choladocola]AQT47997.1 putative metal-dependent peptidase [Bartonella choladocola]